MGAGANLYPAMFMPPWCDEITLVERSPANVEYLERQLDSYEPNWDQFWQALCDNKDYDFFDKDPRECFRKEVKVEQGGIFGLEGSGRWGRCSASPRASNHSRTSSRCSGSKPSPRYGTDIRE
ncbi:hypothetical protein [Streptomyces sp. NBC_00343]|uniref:hypothetical protein n=1 Tax=Streptomyces sp. NBC_00343 TaxID=2975719 RepID=UPI002E2A7E60|nr:hypothetical protein [Streptomyces sp. NBC_00343]